MSVNPTQIEKTTLHFCAAIQALNNAGREYQDPTCVITEDGNQGLLPHMCGCCEGIALSGLTARATTLGIVSSGTFEVEPAGDYKATLRRTGVARAELTIDHGKIDK